MNLNNNIPTYSIRGINLCGFYNMDHFIHYLFSGPKVKTGSLVAINAEKVLTMENQPDIAELINRAEYKYADGVSVVRSIRRKYPAAQVTRIAGADLWEGIMQRAGQEGTPVFLIGGKPAVLEQTKAKLRVQWNVNIVGSQDGYFTPDQQESLFERVKASQAAIVTIAMGSPKQEILMRDCQTIYSQALYMGIGGTYDVFTGHVKRAPKVWQKLGLEWLYRLIHQPSRLGRQLKLLKYLCYHYTGRL